MKQNLSLFSLLLSAIGLFLFVSCTQQAPKPPQEDDETDVSSLTGAGNAFITKEEADTLRHYFDVWHRNRKFYGPTGDNPTSSGSLNDVPAGTAGANDTLSTAVWFDKRVIKYLAKLIDTATACDGVRIYFGAYSRPHMAPGQRGGRPRQATVFLVPTDSVGTYKDYSGFTRVKHKDDFSLVQPFMDRFHIATYGAMNHGELCPDDCQQ
jgi:hypothetical protein